MRKNKLLFLFVAALTAIGARAQQGQYPLEIVEDHATKTAKVVTVRAWNEDYNYHYNPYSGDYVIPSYSPSGYPVTTIGESCFTPTTVRAASRRSPSPPR